MGRDARTERGCEVPRPQHMLLLWLGLSYALIFTLGFVFRFTAQMGTWRWDDAPVPSAVSTVAITIITPNARFERDSLRHTDGFTAPLIAKREAAETEETADIQHPSASTSDKVKVLCWSDKPYGRAMNMVLQLATLLHQAAQFHPHAKVALRHPAYVQFFQEWFDPRDDVLLDYRGPCDVTYNATTLFYLYYPNGWQDVAAQFSTLIPQAEIRVAAQAALQSYGDGPVTTVHRRHLEGECDRKAQERRRLACPTVSAAETMSVADLQNTCAMDYSMIEPTNGTTVLLFTDGQVPRLDRTFPIRSSHPFRVQAWMMALSAVHYGNPFSTCDTVVYFWRKALATDHGGEIAMRPVACYEPTVF